MTTNAPLNVLLIPLGSAGDVHPFFGLAQILRKRGHRPVVMTSPHFKPLADRLGLEFEPLGTAEEYDAVTRNPDLWHPYRGFKIVIRHAMLKPMRQVFDAICRRNVPGSTVVVAQATALGARIAREKHGVPLVTVHLQPAVLRSVFDSPLLPPLKMGPGVPKWFKRLQFYMTDRMLVDRLLASEVNAYRKELGLPPLKRLLDQWWNSPDKVIGLFPEWYAPRQPDWPAVTELADFPLWDEAETREIPAELATFLAAGPPPVVFTPGSAMRLGAGFFTAAVEACRRSGRRGLLLTPYHEQVPELLPPEIAHFEYVPFSHVLPRAAAVVHHGGIGTVAQSLAAGVPQLIMPMSHDQPDNAARVARLGVGASVRPKAFRGPRVAAVLDKLLDSPDIAGRCRELAGRFQPGRGLELAATQIEAVVFGAAPRNDPRAEPGAMGRVHK